MKTRRDYQREYMRRWNTPERVAWAAMKARCSNPEHRYYQDYGGRGIYVCDRWLSDFDAFLADMGKRPHPSYSLDRIDNDKGYSPENCRWADKRTQTINSRVRRNSKSGHKGITWNTKAGKWLVYVGRIYIGLYLELEDAIKARKENIGILTPELSSKEKENA